jgi:hypothetical protein
MKATPILPERANLAIQLQPTFRCVLIYENAAAGKCGEHFYQNLLAAVDADCASTRNLWSFSALTIPEMRNVAASAAATAEIVIFALSGEEELPAHVKEWIEMWLWLIDGGHPAFVPLFHSASAKSAAIGGYLRSATASKHLDCFPHVASFNAPPPVTTLPDAQFPSGELRHVAESAGATAPQNSRRRLNE